jgi:SAM-dependent methyltransferase
MDPRTLSYYERHAPDLAARDEQRASSGISQYFPLAFPPGARVLDVGAGTGRDAALLARAGYDVRAIEPSAALREVALQRHAEQLRERLFPGSLPDALPHADALDGPFDGVLCSAVLQHLPRRALFDAVLTLRRLLSPRGRVLVSIPASSGGTSAAGDAPGRILDAEHRDADGRLYTPIAADELRLLFERCGFATTGSWQDPDALGRPGLHWHTLLFELGAASGSR